MSVTGRNFRRMDGDKSTNFFLIFIGIIWSNFKRDSAITDSFYKPVSRLYLEGKCTQIRNSLFCSTFFEISHKIVFV
jgi:hypothetical protein